MSLFKLDNVIQNYAWGSKDSINQLFGIVNPKHEPQAEIWMGAHPNGCSKVGGTEKSLSHIIEENRVQVLGDYTASRFGELPFLFKVLAAEKPLSIQVHPNKRKSELGFARENQLGIPLNAENRNYKDPNHKPELVYALTFYKAMNGFRPIADIIALFEEVGIPSLSDQFNRFKTEADSEALKQFFSVIMSLTGERKQQALDELYAAYARAPKTAMAREALQYSQEFNQHYQDDIGLFAPLLLNTIELAPGEAMFLHAETPHAYVQGTGLEIMANSDNVLRAGLTAKHIDVPELIDNTRFESTKLESIRLQPVLKEGKMSYPIPVDDFGFDVLSATDEIKSQYLRSAEILFCIEGEVSVTSEEQVLTLKPGESVFVSNESMIYRYHGNGILGRAYN